jgi:hemolysin III
VLRGVSHELAAIGALPLALLLVLDARSGAGLAGAIVYGSSLVTLFLVSALYHRPTWGPRARTLLGRVDHAAIFLFIAGTYTPLCLLMGPGPGHALLVAVWVLAGFGGLLVCIWDDAPKAVRAALYGGLGWAFLPTVPTFTAALGSGALAWLFGGALLYSLGAIVFARRWPDPAPGWFGYHEVFHALVVAAAACHYLVVARAVTVLG